MTTALAGDLRLALVGAGKMGGALLEGWLRLGLAGERISVFDPQPAPDLVARCAAAGIGLNPPAGAAPDILVLAIKPQMLADAAPGLAALAGPQTLVVSVVAGKTIANLAAAMPQASVFIRAMPNTPAAVGRGITGLVAGAGASAAQRAAVDALMAAVGAVVWLDDEAQIDAVTAVSGSGPAYVFLLAECLAAAGVAAGLPADLAARLARATVEGAGELLHREPGSPPDLLRRNVTSPGGTTAAALAVLMAADGLEPLMVRAVAAAKARAAALAG